MHLHAGCCSRSVVCALCTCRPCRAERAAPDRRRPAHGGRQAGFHRHVSVADVSAGPGARPLERHGLRSQELRAAQAGRRGVPRAADRRSAPRRAARLLHAGRLSRRHPVRQRDAVLPDEELPGHGARVPAHDARSSRSTAGRIAKGLEPMFYGDPVGKWEGDTLVDRHHEFQALGARRLLLHQPEGVPDAQRRAAHDRAARAGRARPRSPTR